MTMRLIDISRYPVKGLSPEALDDIALEAGEGLPDDRRFAIARASSDFDAANPKWAPKTNFVMLAKFPRLAKLTTRYDHETGMLSIERAGKRVAGGNILQPVGRAMIADFIQAFLEGEINGTPRLVEAQGHMFSDHRNKVVSIISTASLKDLERVVGQPVAPHRFRANLMIDGAEPWAEFDWIGRDLRIGTARLQVTQRIDRCAATNANPETGEVDMNIPLALRRGFGHIDFGVYAQVVEEGAIHVGDEVELL